VLHSNPKSLVLVKMKGKQTNFGMVVAEASATHGLIGRLLAAVQEHHRLHRGSHLRSDEHERGIALDRRLFRQK